MANRVGEPMKPIVVWLCCLTLIAALLFGGAASQGLAADGIAEFVGLILFALAAPLAGPALARTPSAFALLVGLAILPCLQLIPLPDWLWSALPGRQPVMDIFAAAHVKPGWRPASLIPGATLRTLLSLLPATAIFLAALTLDAGDRMKLFWTVIAVGALSVPIAMLQVLGGDNGPYFYAITNIGNGVGFFANSNHFADLEYLLAPLCAVAVIAAPLSAGAARNTIAAGLTAILLF